MAENLQTLERPLEGNGVMQKILRLVTRTKTGKALLFGGTLLTTVTVISCSSSDGGGGKGGGGGGSRPYSWTCNDDPDFPHHYDVSKLASDVIPNKLLPYTLNTKEVAAEGQANLPSGEYRVVIWELMNSKTGKAYWQHPKGKKGVEKMSYAQFIKSDPGIANDPNRLASCN